MRNRTRSGAWRAPPRGWSGLDEAGGTGGWDELALGEAAQG